MEVMCDRVKDVIARPGVSPTTMLCTSDHHFMILRPPCYAPPTTMLHTRLLCTTDQTVTPVILLLLCTTDQTVTPVTLLLLWTTYQTVTPVTLHLSPLLSSCLFQVAAPVTLLLLCTTYETVTPVTLLLLPSTSLRYSPAVCSKSPHNKEQCGLD